ncbi:MAG TPA: polysaccharide biosynthesis tyrosine autokinase [Planctomicrobium sp.]|nr:polysaccharide biosynthesis tyrosine autokinase [Planctomicrobium sp.]
MSETPAQSTSLASMKSALNSVPGATVDVIAVIRKNVPLIFFCGVLGILAGVTYWANAQDWYESKAKMLVTLKDMRSGSGERRDAASWGSDRIQDEVLANHMEIFSSRRIVGNALKRANWENLPGVVAQVTEDQDAIAYVIDSLTLSKGGKGTARTARSLNIAFRHTDPDESMIVLNSLVEEYEHFLNDQVNRIMSEANRLILQVQDNVEKDLKQLEESYVDARRNAPILYSGEGNGNVYLEQFRRLQDELMTVEIERSTVATRLQNVVDSINQIKAVNGDPLEMLALIDTDSLTRLGTFAGFSSAQTSEFQQAQAARLQEAQTKYGKLTNLQADLAKHEANFGPGHPVVENLRREIQLVERVLRDSERATQYNPIFDKLTPELLLRAYTGFLQHDLAALNERKRQLDLLASEAETSSKSLIEFEMRDRMLLGEINRKQALFESIVNQLRDLDTAAGLSGYIHEVLEEPQLGESVWPKLSLCLAGGLLLGLLAGASIALLSDQLDNRFRSPTEIDSTLGIPVIAQVGKINRSRDKRKSGRVLVDAQAPEAEAFRLMRTYLLREVKTGNVRTAMVTSSQAKDGKSTILTNLGASFSELGLKVLVIDGDMRAPTVHRFLNMSIDRGLSEVLQGKAESEDVIRETGVEGFYLMTAGGAVRNPAELLQSDVFDKLLEKCKQSFDMILVDSGPVLLVSDPAIVSQKCDISMLVIRPSVDPKQKVMEAVRRLRASKSNLRGCILNTYGSSNEFTREAGYGNSSYYGYGYGNRGYGRRVDGEEGKVKSSSRVHRENGRENGKSSNGAQRHDA